MQNNFEKNAIIECTIEGYTAEGMGVGRIDGYAVFVPRAVRGDVLTVRIIKPLKNYAFARIEQIVTPSEYRISPLCPHFGTCGGCDFQHISYDEELYLKQKRVSDALSRIGGFEISAEACIPSPKLEAYRNKCQFPVGGDEAAAFFGFYRSRSHNIVPISSCMIQDERANILANAVCRWIEENLISVYNEENNTGLIRHVYVRSGGKGVQLTVVSTSRGCARWQALVCAALAACPDITSIVLNINQHQTNRVLGEQNITLWGSDVLQDEMLGMKFSLSPLAFYQVNHAQAENVYKYILELAKSADCKTALDLYCGTGTITLALAKVMEKVTGIEISAAAVDDAQKNAGVNGVSNVRFMCGDAALAAEELAEGGMKPDVIVTDPPRKGMDGQAIDAILQMQPRSIIYVSCDCASLARDAKLLAAGGYRLVSAQPFDMFPRTANIETVCLLSNQKL